MAKKKRKKRVQYTEAERARVLAAAKAENLTALQIQKKFGVTPVTYYSWRKKTGLTRPRGGALAAAIPVTGAMNARVRAEVKSKVRQILPGVVRAEVNAYLDSLFGAKRRRRAAK
jgi:transposase-like protein